MESALLRAGVVTWGAANEQPGLKARLNKEAGANGVRPP
jgi:hypothetical protein